MNRAQVEAVLYFYTQIDSEINLLHQMKRRTAAFYPSGDMPPEIVKELDRQEHQRRQLAAVKAEIVAGLEKLEPVTKTIIFYYYVLQKNWQDISRIVHYSPRSCQYKRTEGINQLTQIYDQSALLQNFKE